MLLFLSGRAIEGINLTRELLWGGYIKFTYTIIFLSVDDN